nr:MAG TPA: hypothetical protein [Caudoviricetes sp.]
MICMIKICRHSSSLFTTFCIKPNKHIWAYYSLVICSPIIISISTAITIRI